MTIEDILKVLWGLRRNLTNDSRQSYGNVPNVSTRGIVVHDFWTATCVHHLYYRRVDYRSSRVGCRC